MEVQFASIQEWLMTSGLRIAGVIVALIVAIIVFRLVVGRFSGRLAKQRPDPEDQKRVETLSRVFRMVILVVLLLIAGMMIADELGVDMRPLLGAAGIVGLAIGFGAQNLARDLIAGVFLLVENQVRVGDVVEVDGVGGLVEAVKLRTLVLRDLAGSVHIVPNGAIGRVTNMTKDYSRYVLDLGISYYEDVDEVIRVLQEIGEELQRDPDFGPDIREPLEIFGVDEFADSQVTIKMRITTTPIQQWRVGRELRRRIKKTFDERGIEIPFPHLTLFVGAPKQGEPSPLRVNVTEETR